MRCLLTSVRRPSCGHVSKTKQDRPTLTIEHYIKLTSLILLPHSDPSRPPGDILVWNIKNVAILMRSPVWLWSQTTAIVNRARPSSHSRCCRRCATVVICYQQSSSVVLTTPAVRRQSFFSIGDILVLTRLKLFRTVGVQQTWMRKQVSGLWTILHSLPPPMRRLHDQVGLTVNRCHVCASITEKVMSRFHWNVFMIGSSNLKNWLTFGGDMVTDTDSGSLFHFPHYCGMGDF